MVKGIVVGGSLAGLASAVALAEAGVDVQLFEKKPKNPGTGGGLGMQTIQPGDNEFARLLKGLVLDENEEALASYGHVAKGWNEIYGIYLSHLENQTDADLNFDSRVTEVGQTEDLAYVIANGERYEADFVLGADGHRSLTRAQVDPNKPDATYAGYLNWMGSVSEADLDPKLRRLDRTVGYEYVVPGTGKILIGFIMPNEEGSETPGKRQVNFAQYDARSNDIARRLGALEGQKAMHSIQGSDLTDEEVQGLIDRLHKEPWPEPFQSAMVYALPRREFRGILLKEYVPDHLANGRIAIVGDAAHVATSWTGMGFNASLQDAASIAQIIKDSQATTEDMPQVLASYEADRLQAVRRIVLGGNSFSRSFREEY